MQDLHIPFLFCMLLSYWREGGYHVYAHAHMYVCGGQRLGLAIFLSCSSPTFFMRQHLSLSPGLTNSAILVGQQVPGVPLSSPPQSWDYKCVVMNMAYKVGPLPTELPP